MTALAPIDLVLDKHQCVALIDLENIRLSWQRTYLRVFEYADLVLLIGLMERLMESKISRLVIFATDPDEFRTHQVKSLAIREKFLPVGVYTVSDPEVRTLTMRLQQRGISLPEDVEAGYRLIREIQKDVEMCAKQKPAQQQQTLKRSNQQDLSHPSAKRLKKGEVLTIDEEEDKQGIVSKEDTITQATTSQTAELLTSQTEDETGAVGEPGAIDDEAAMEGTENGGVTATVSLHAASTDNAEVEIPNSASASSQASSSQSSSSSSDASDIEVIEEDDDDDDEITIISPPEKATSPSASTANARRLLGADGLCEVECRLYGFKTAQGRVVQRGCDVALGAEIMKACFHPNVEKICLFSADSDFQELMQQNMTPENIGGVYKFAKTSWVCGFRSSFRSEQIAELRRLQNHTSHLKGVMYVQNARYVLLDVAFPQIKTFLDQQKIARKPWFPQEKRNVNRLVPPMMPEVSLPPETLKSLHPTAQTS